MSDSVKKDSGIDALWATKDTLMNDEDSQAHNTDAHTQPGTAAADNENLDPKGKHDNQKS